MLDVVSLTIKVMMVREYPRRRSGINFLPDSPVGVDDAALEHEREQLELEVKKKTWT